MHALSLSATLILSVCLPSLGSAQTIADDTGLTALTEHLGAGNVPTGAGVIVGQIEASAPGYLPDAGNAEFAGKTILAMSSGMGVSGHATTVGRHYFGLSTGIAPGIDEVHCWEANNWTLGGFLNGTGNTPPDLVAFKVMNHSWIGGGLNPAKQVRKVDYAIREQDLVACVGVGNGTGNLSNPLLSHAFNVISVGRSDGSHKAGGTGNGIEVPGRHKPEMVAPGSATSFATPLVSGAASLLVETARTHPDLMGDPDAERAHAWLPDMARAGVMLAEKRAELPGFTDVCLPGLTVSTNQIAAAISQQTGRNLQVKTFPWWLFTVTAPVWELAREMKEMRYLYSTPHRLSGDRLAQILPEFTGTSLERVIAEILLERAPKAAAA